MQEPTLSFSHLKAGLLDRSQYESGKSCYRPTRLIFLCFFSVLDQKLSWYPNLTLHCILLISRLNINAKISPQTQPSQRHQKFVIRHPSQHKIQQNSKSSPNPELLFLLPTQTVHFLTLYLPPAYLCQKDELERLGHLQNSNKLTVSYYTPPSTHSAHLVSL